MKRLPIGAAVLVLLLAATADAFAAQGRRGRIYDAVAGHRDPGSGTGQSFFSLDVSAGGTRVTVSRGEWGLPCVAGPAKGTVLAPDTTEPTVSLRRNGSFVASLKLLDSNSGHPSADSPIVVTGKFVTASKASGPISFEGTAADDKGCKARASWTATLRPLNDHFVGRTSTGARVSFDRTVEPRPVVWNVSVGKSPRAVGQMAIRF